MAKNQLILSLNNALALNNANISNNGIHPDPIQVPNAISYMPSLMMEYQRTTSYGFIYGTGIEMGIYKQNFDVVYNTFDWLDTMQELKDDTYSFSYRNKSMYVGLRLFIGYTFTLNTKKDHLSYLDVKLGITNRIYLSGGHDEKYLNAQILSNDTFFIGYTPTYIGNSWGNDMGNTSNIADFYIGVRKKVNRHFLTNINLGIYGTYLLSFGQSERYDVTVRNGHYFRGEFKYVDVDHYLERGAALGIRLGFGLSF